MLRYKKPIIHLKKLIYKRTANKRIVGKKAVG